MELDDLFPSKYLKPVDLGTREAVVTIDHVDVQVVGQRQQRKPVVYFVSKQKALILNRTNAEAIAELAGSRDTANWRGLQLRLYATRVKFGDKMVDAIRIKRATPVVQHGAA